jgi:hypothetical protein
LNDAAAILVAQELQKQENSNAEQNTVMPPGSNEPQNDRSNYGGTLDDPLQEMEGGAQEGRLATKVTGGLHGDPNVLIELSSKLDIKLVNECLNSWKEAGIPLEVYGNYLVRNMQVNLANANGAAVFYDKVETAESSFMIVSLSGKNLNSSVAQLLNPKGWYCIHVEAQNMNGFSIQKKKTGNVKILSQSFQNANSFQIEDVE